MAPNFRTLNVIHRHKMAYKPKPANFSDAGGCSVSLSSSWASQVRTMNCETQTPDAMYEFAETETQWGLFTSIDQYQTGKDDTGETVMGYLRKKFHRKRSGEQLRNLLSSRCVTVDDEACTDGNMKLTGDEFIEVVVAQLDATTQTSAYDASVAIEAQTTSSSSSSASEGKASDREGEGKDMDRDRDRGEDTYEDDFDEGKRRERDGEEGKSSDSSGGEPTTANANTTDRNLLSFLRKICPTIEDELAANLTSRAFDGYDSIISSGTSDEVSLWKTLSVDLEKKKVVFPGWTSAKYFPGRIVKCSQTRNKERIYDVLYEDDGSSLSGVREEHIRVVHLKQCREEVFNEQATRKAALRVGVRVHVKTAIDKKGREERHLPGTITKAGKGKSGVYDVELEGGKVIEGVLKEDILVGLDVDMSVEARRPTRQHLHCTDVSWNSTGNSLAASYGRTDISGWCDLPGAVCIWSVFSKGFDAATPTIVLDHPSCINCVACHPEQPALIAAGSFNGEVILWDTSGTSGEEAVGISPIVEFCHKEPVLAIQWAYDDRLGDWTILSAGADGKVLNWHPSNRLRYPVKGSYLSKPGSSGSSSRKEYPLAYGGTSLALSGGSGVVSGSSLSKRPKWVLVGQEGGAIIRAQATRALVMSGRAMSSDSIKASLRAGSDLYTPLRGIGEGFAHTPHIGPVNSLDCSPFHRSLFLTAGQDGYVRLYHMLRSQPLLQWEPNPAPGTAGVEGAGAFGAVTGAKFSPIRPCVFAASTSNGFVYIFDLMQSTAAPVCTLQAESSTTSGGKSGSSKSRTSLATLTSLGFNPKQRDLLAASDQAGMVHTWRLGWNLSNRHPLDQQTLDALGAADGGDDQE